MELWVGSTQPQFHQFRTAPSLFFFQTEDLECPVLAAKGERASVALRAGETRGAVPGSSGQLRAAPGSSGAPRRSINQNASMNMQISLPEQSVPISLVGRDIWLLSDASGVKVEFEPRWGVFS